MEDEYSEESEFSPVEKEFQSRIEKVFFDDLKKGKNLQSYLYMPAEYVNEKMHLEIQRYLIREAYSYLIEKKDNNGNVIEDDDGRIVYRDNISVLRIAEESKLDLLNRMLDYFTEIEAYEKCIEILNFKKNYEEKT